MALDLLVKDPPSSTAGSRGSPCSRRAVWNRVHEYQATLSAPSQTSALDDVYAHVSPELDTTIAAFVTSTDDEHGTTRAPRVIDRNRWFGPTE